MAIDGVKPGSDDRAATGYERRFWRTLKHWASIPAMDPADPFGHTFPLAPGSQTTWYLPWLKVSGALRRVPTFPWAPDAWPEVRQHNPWVPSEQHRLRIAGWFN